MLQHNILFSIIIILLFLFIVVPITADTLTFITEFEKYSNNTGINYFIPKIQVNGKSDAKQIDADNIAAFSIVLNGNYMGPLYLSTESITMLSPGGKKIDEIPFWLSYVKGLRPTTLYLSADGRIYEDSSSVKKIKIGEVVALPVFDPLPEDGDGTKIMHSISHEVSLTTEPEGAAIKYTIDGSDPEDNGVEIANGEKVILTTTTTLKAIGVKVDWINSDIASFKYFFKVANPAIVCNEAHAVTIKPARENTVIWYTIDGQNPIPGKSLRYKDSFVIEENTTVKAIATRSGDTQSDTIEASFTIE